jgi:hypothetical protein
MNMLDILSILGNMLNEMSPYILLGFLFAGVLHAFVKPNVLSHHLAGNGFKQSLKAALFGVPLPLCSCGVLPTAISLRRNGASTSATTAFLIATPQTGVDSIAATYSLLGLGFAIVRPIAAFLSAIFGGTLIGKFAKEEHLADTANCELDQANLQPTLWGKIKETLRYGFVDMVESVGKWLVIGLVIASLITILVPDDFFARFAEYPIAAMLVVVVVAIPMYVCATGSIPIALSLMMKGLTPGVAFVFLMAGPAVNFASYTLLSRAIGRRSTLLYIFTIALSAIGVGVIIDYLLPSAWFIPKMTNTPICCTEHTDWLGIVCSAIVCTLLFYVFIIKKYRHNKLHCQLKMAKQYRIDGMACVHCKSRVEKGLLEVEGVTAATVDLDKKVAIVEGTATDEAIKAKVEGLGYEYVGIVDSSD